MRLPFALFLALSFDTFVYVEGRQFIERLHRAGGHDRVWQTLVHPPIHRADITAPDVP